MDALIPDTWTADAILGDVATLLGNSLFLSLLGIVAAFVFGPRIFRLIVRMLKSA